MQFSSEIEACNVWQPIRGKCNLKYISQLIKVHSSRSTRQHQMEKTRRDCFARKAPKEVGIFLFASAPEIAHRSQMSVWSLNYNTQLKQSLKNSC